MAAHPLTPALCLIHISCQCLEAINEGDAGITTIYTIKAIAVAAGLRDSEVSTFEYTLSRRSKDVYIVKDISPGVQMILDFDDTKMMLIKGSKRAMLIDAGLGAGDLRGFVEQLASELPLDVVISHGHPDHIACMGQFQGRYDVYMNRLDLPLVHRFIERLNYQIDPENIIDLREGHVFDLGDRKFEVFEVPGHSPGCLVLFDEANGVLLAGDALGSNRPTIPDALWMQNPGMGPVDTYLSALQRFRSKVKGRIKVIYGGHNDAPIYGEAYLDNLQQAAQNLVDGGEDILEPALRPTTAWMVVVGDRLSDPNWAAINVAKGTCLTASPDKIATLSHLQVDGAVLNERFSPSRLQYTATAPAGAHEIAITPTAMSTRHKGLAINGMPAQSGAPFIAQMESRDTTFDITITSPDGSETQRYTLTVHKPA